MEPRLETPLSNVEVTNYNRIPKDEQTAFQHDVLDGNTEGKVK
jgi:hypothetical protein